MNKVILILSSIFIGHAAFSEEKVEEPSFKFTNESEVSLIQTGGNSNVETYNGKTLSKFDKKKSVYSVSGHYTVAFYKTTDDDGDSVKAESARNWSAQGKYERKLSDRFNGFTAVLYEGDEFSGFKQRENIDIGGKYSIIKSDKINSSIEVGGRYTIEKNVERNEDDEDIFNYSKARIYLEHSQVYSEALTWKFWIEYLPNFTDGDDYLVNYEPSLTLLLSSTFSLKTAYNVTYDNVPNLEDNDKRDYKFTTSLLARF